MILLPRHFATTAIETIIAGFRYYSSLIVLPSAKFAQFLTTLDVHPPLRSHHFCCAAEHSLPKKIEKRTRKENYSLAVTLGFCWQTVVPKFKRGFEQ